MLINSINRTISMMGQLLDPRKSTVPMIDLPSNKPSCSGGGVKQPLPRIKPEAAGVSSAHIEAFVREVLADKTIRMHGLMILRGGKVIYETSFGNQDLSVWKYTFSACKSVTSLAVGMLIDEGKLQLEDRIIDLFPEKATAVNRL
ncbi:MAG: serine hydrolase, partial [Lachnospiraceae bacterium]|nr:serine hydrolase [Lachnospiraceae bacterium]